VKRCLLRTSLQKVPILLGRYGPHLIHGSLGQPSPQPRRHLDRFLYQRKLRPSLKKHSTSLACCDLDVQQPILIGLTVSQSRRRLVRESNKIHYNVTVFMRSSASLQGRNFHIPIQLSKPYKTVPRLHIYPSFH